jgi:hypothetical protein
MPWMPDKMPSLPNGGANTDGTQTNIAVNNQIDIKSAEKRILSSTEHLNEILSLNVLVNVNTAFSLVLMPGTNLGDKDRRRIISDADFHSTSKTRKNDSTRHRTTE